MEFNKDGTLDPGIHKMTWEEFYAFFSFSERRIELLKGLEKVVAILREIGATHIYIDGSFVTNKLDPKDWDACYDCPLSQLDKLARIYPFHSKEEQKRLYKGELYFAGHSPFFINRDVSYLDFFQKRKENPALKKGIVELID